MYRHNNFNSGELGDVEVIYHDGKIHLFHLCSPSNDKVAHLASDDGIKWMELPTAITTGAPGEFDDDMIWTMGVIEHKGKFYMHYTALCSKESGRVQRTGLAVSDDLIHWEKVSAKPVMSAQLPYETKLADKRRMVSWRDPKIYIEDGRFYCVVCAREDRGPFLFRGSAALCTSDDLIHWHIDKPLFAPREYYDLECPQLIKRGKFYYLIASVMEGPVQRYWISENIKGPYRTPAENVLTPMINYAGKICEVGSEHWYFCWTQFKADGPDPDGSYLSVGKTVKYIPTPLVVKQNADGTLYLAPNKSWEKYYDKSVALKFAKKGILENPFAKVSVGSKITVESKQGRALIVTSNSVRDFAFEGKLKMSASRAGIGLYIDPKEADGYFMEIIPTRNTVRLIKHLRIPHNDGCDWIRHEILQEGYYEIKSSKPTFDFLLRVVKGEIRFSIANKIIISKPSFERNTGRLAIWAVDGQLTLTQAKLTSICLK